MSYPLVLRSSFLFELSELKTCRVVVRVQGLKRVCNFGPLWRGMLVSVDRLAVPQYQLCKNTGVGDSVRVRGTFPLLPAVDRRCVRKLYSRASCVNKMTQ